MAVAELELALEIDAPQIVGGERLRQVRSHGLVRPSPLPGLAHKAVPVEHGMDGARHTSPMPSPSRRRPTKRTRSSITEHSFHGINTSRKAKSATHVSGTKRHLCLGSLSGPFLSHGSNFLPEEWLTVSGVNGSGPGSTRSSSLSKNPVWLRTECRYPCGSQLGVRTP